MAKMLFKIADKSAKNIRKHNKTRREKKRTQPTLAHRNNITNISNKMQFDNFKHSAVACTQTHTHFIYLYKNNDAVSVHKISVPE